MRDYVIFTDGGASLLPNICLEHDIRCISMDYLLNDQPFHYSPAQEDAEAVCTAFYDALRAGASVSTSQITLFMFEEAFRPVLEQGLDILYCCFSGGLSSTWQMAQQALAQLSEEYPQATLRFVDTRSAAAGLGVFVMQAVRNKAAGMTVEENADALQQRVQQCCHWFTVSDLDFLKRGGRVSPAVAFFGSKLNIRPMLKIDPEGKLVVYGKVRGQTASMDDLIKHLTDTLYDATDTIWLDHSGVPDLGAELAERVKQAAPKAQVQLVPLSPIIGAHTGPGMLSVCHFGTQR